MKPLLTAMLALYLTFLYIACNNPKPFMWRDEAGHICEPQYVDESGDVHGASYDLICNEEPVADCSSDYHPCWLLDEEYFTDAKDLNYSLCLGCCGVGFKTFHNTCSPLYCDEEDQAPPLPFVCRGTKIFLDWDY